MNPAHSPLPENGPSRAGATHSGAWLLVRLTWILLAVGLLWRVLRYALGFPFWGDESFVAVNFVVRDYRGLIDPLVYGQIVPLVFMWTNLAISHVFGLSEWALRLLPMLAGVAALLLFWRFTSRVLPRRAAVLALGIFAISFYIVRHGAEVKPYATDLLVALVLTMLAWHVLQVPRSAGWWIALILAAGIGVWCSYPAVFVAGGAGLLLTWLVWRERFRPGVLAGWLVYGLTLGGSFLAMYMLYARPHAQAAARLTEIDMWTKAFPPITHPLKLLGWLVAIHTGEMFAYPHGARWPGSSATFVLFIIGCIRMWRMRRELIFLLLTPFPLTFIAALLKAYPYGGSARTSLYLAPAICLLAGLGLYQVLRWVAHIRPNTSELIDAVARLALKPWALRSSVAAGRRPTTRLLAMIDIVAFIFALVAVVAMVSDAVRPYQSPASLRSKAAVVTVARQSKPADRWVIFNADREVPYAPYLGDWAGAGGEFVFDALRFAPAPPDWAPPPENVALPPGGRVWLLVYRVDHVKKKVDFPEEQLAAYLATLTRNLGQPAPQSFNIKIEPGKAEVLEVYRFGP